ncbi:MAG: hypothetical protein KA807_13160, partial [Prolixibacteraceae bacterium]|nr:hypothetical protein [Prolixibacteraceae bacterium]
MKVLIVYKKFNEIGGSELQLSILINALIHNGNEIQLFTTNFNNKLFNNIDINRIDLIIKRNLFFPLFRIISRLNPSLIFTRDTRHLYKYILISKLFKSPVVYNVNQNISLLPQNFFQLIRQILPDTLKLSFPYWA